MMKRECIGGIGLAFLIAVSFFPTAAVAVPASTVVINVSASGSGTYTQPFDTGIAWKDVLKHPDTRYTWSLKDYYPDGYTFDFGNGHTGTLESLTVGLKADPTVEIGFSAISTNGDTNFVFTTDVLTFAPLTDVTADVYATASCLKHTTVSALDFPGKLCRSLYNGTEIFADVVNPFSFPGGGPAYVEAPISGQVSSMQLMWSLRVNSGGHADGLSEFEILGTAIPEPATMALLGLGGLALIRKRRA